MENSLGRGSYGQVVARHGKAVKQFSKLSHLIQEYMALKYLSDCTYVVHERGADFAALELHMELYDCSLRTWLFEEKNHGNRMKLLHDILQGLVELHDRNLAHGDLKPGNVLVRRKPLGAVLGDCGFVSIAKYAKVDRTAPTYRDPVIEHSWTHDMYSFGICFLEMIGSIKLTEQTNYSELRRLIAHKIPSQHRNLAASLVHRHKDQRPTARKVLHQLFTVDVERWQPSAIVMKESTINILEEDQIKIRRLMKRCAEHCKISRAQKGYGACIIFLNTHDVPRDHYRLHALVTLMITSSTFGRSGFGENEVRKLMGKSCTNNHIYSTLRQMLNDDIYLRTLLQP